MRANSARPTQSAEEYWDKTAANYDDLFPNKIIGQAEREIVWYEFDRVFASGERILELNCGTGIDAVHLAERGVRVAACDLSPGMIEAARRRADRAGLNGLVEFRVLRTEDLGSLGAQATFDGAFSNFSGLNCVQDLSGVARNLAALVRPGGRLLLCMVGRWAPWEAVWYLAHGNPRRALVRLSQDSEGRQADVPVFYHSVSSMVRNFTPEFRLRGRRGIGVAMPSPQFERWARLYPRTFRFLARADGTLGRWPVLRGMGDCMLLEFERVSS